MNDTTTMEMDNIFQKIPKDLFRWFLIKYVSAADTLSLLKTSKTLYNASRVSQLPQLSLQMPSHPSLQRNDFYFKCQKKSILQAYQQKQKDYFKRECPLTNTVKTFIMCNICEAYLYEENVERHNIKAKRGHDAIINGNGIKKKPRRCENCRAIFPTRRWSPHDTYGCPFDITHCLDDLKNVWNDFIVEPDCTFMGNAIDLQYHRKDCKVWCKMCNDYISRKQESLASHITTHHLEIRKSQRKYENMNKWFKWGCVVAISGIGYYYYI
jgi:hypothetical protein